MANVGVRLACRNVRRRPECHGVVVEIEIFPVRFEVYIIEMIHVVQSDASTITELMGDWARHGLIVGTARVSERRARSGHDTMGWAGTRVRACSDCIV